MNNFFLTNAIVVEHPLGEFYLTALPAKVLVDCTFSDPVKDFDGGLLGLERRISKKRVDEIGNYIRTVESVFPGTIILAANWLPGNEKLDDEDERSWKIVMANNSKDLVQIRIPYRDKRVVAIVDGQHRINGFKVLFERICRGAIDVHEPESLYQMRLPCAIFFGLTPPQQATVFATINYNQKPVDKSLSYRLFGYDLQDVDARYWTPEKLAVFLTRKLNQDETSPFKDHVKVAAVDGRLTSENRDQWVVSVATIVEGFLKLYSRCPKQDRDTMLLKRFSTRNELQDDGTPLRDDYIKGYDGLIYDCVKNFFKVVHKKLWNKPENVFLRKTAGIQALFLVLFDFVGIMRERGDVRESVWETLLKPLWEQGGVLSDPLLKESSARGRSNIYKKILETITPCET